MDFWTAVVTGLLTLSGVGIGAFAPLIKDFFGDRRQAERERKQRRWTLEFESLQELHDVVIRFTGPELRTSVVEPDKVRAAGLAFRIRDERPKRAIEILLAMPTGGQGWRDQVGIVIREIGSAMRDLDVD
jgi:hypothetical protein